MAGEIEEPLRFNFQADLLHSGSISFGRFESESLSWERRSSFSHNRYLEEVEKYSKPGSVTEKKAYFEAHFRRKALLKQNSSECQDGREFQTNEIDDPHDLEESENGNESKHLTCFDESPHSSGHSKYDEEPKVRKYEKENVETLYAENDNESRHVTSFDESPRSSEYDEEAKFQERERKNFEFLCASPQDESVINTVDQPVGGPEHFKLEEAHQSGTENVVLVKSEENNGETVIDMLVQVDVASEANDSSLTSHTAEKDDDSANSGPQRMISPKVTPALEMKLRKPKLKAQPNVAQVQRSNSSEASNASVKPKLKESEGSLMKKKEKKSSRPASPVTRSGGRTSKSEEPSMSFPKAKVLAPKKSIVKELKSEKAVEAQSSVLEKSFPGVRQTANRPKPIISPSKPLINQRAPGFSFKSDQRAERRKEEKAAAEMKQFRKSLNFKATPMPSFYIESARCSDQNKGTSTSQTPPNKPRTPSSHSVATRTDRFPSNSTAPSHTRPTSSTSSIDRTCPSESARKTQVPEKQKDMKEPEATKGPRARARARARATLRQDAKGLHMGGGSKLGYLAVGVAS